VVAGFHDQVGSADLVGSVDSVGHLHFDCFVPFAPFEHLPLQAPVVDKSDRLVVSPASFSNS
jgi:hypothetical protein